ncbi:hypothetical protein GLOIN_2v1764458 [Rhizophagus irregularis DAOM 181602=DAOM 197198]|uniref:Uncharacterized protein n=1 Tax=Rhizophagus irregularis (strain DAOM 181602 / DAOM 197198 / MUCL 43194) TaxID=747089 RepID=A0A2P4QRV5_RHIID|nr:hypothetical protein GLOIN_2v1764458 [Rhizophagus irregularis DAOM 181602=DAOM 197198]POG80345.1 hypothetical protein GLOIN_2v1764458 [Rhizophagus irregularis DAOM 181602=DAOM 197198]GET50259.1 hypothetical protein GLOIN_2v1764458 [Rhizophagus irregularis DAOM 181602=DAOM 197198]|eukprot:XP_025187211.1 hypothetical protein GLOIN_2v1764458 [Rhizophagus irregularis DAOM 181602=DAOM 197198]
MSFNIASFSNKKLNGYLKMRSNNIDKYIDILTAQKVDEQQIKKLMQKNNSLKKKLAQLKKIAITDNKPYSFYICDYYDYLLDIALNHDVRNLHITGNPGIRKPFFGYYLLYILIQNNKTVIYEDYNMKNCVILFSQKKVSYLNSILNNKEIQSYLYKRRNLRVLELYKKWGGIPYYILESANNSDILNELEKAIELYNDYARNHNRFNEKN